MVGYRPSDVCRSDGEDEDDLGGDGPRLPRYDGLKGKGGRERGEDLAGEVECGGTDVATILW